MSQSQAKKEVSQAQVQPQYVRQNKNFLERPIFNVNEIDANTLKQIWTPAEGFRLETDYKIPSRTDQIVMYYFMLMSQKKQWQTELTFSKYEILKQCGLKTGKKEYERLNDTLERWFRLRVYYENSFTCIEKGRTYKVKGAFRILNSYDLVDEKNKKQSGRKRVQVQLSSKWIEVVRTHSYFQQLNFEALRSLSSPLSMRLYEILSKNFYERDTWRIDALKLAEIIPMQVKYPSDVVKKVKPIIEHINEALAGSAVFSVSIKSIARGSTMLTFFKKTIIQEPDMSFPGKPAPVPVTIQHQADTSTTLIKPIERSGTEVEFDALAYFETLPQDEQDSMIEKFTATLPQFSLNRFRRKGLPAVKIEFAEFCKSKLDR